MPNQTVKGLTSKSLKQRFGNVVTEPERSQFQAYVSGVQVTMTNNPFTTLAMAFRFILIAAFQFMGRDYEASAESVDRCLGLFGFRQAIRLAVRSRTGVSAKRFDWCCHGGGCPFNVLLGSPRSLSSGSR